MTQSTAFNPIPGFPGYEITRDGVVRSRRRSLRILRPRQTENGYWNVHLYLDGSGRPYGVHRLVLLTYVGLPLEGQQACHNDGNKSNNSVSNLRWDSPAANTADIIRHGHHFNGNKTHCPQGHPYDAANTHYPPDGSRRCRECNRRRANENYRRKRAARLALENTEVVHGSE